MQLSVENYMEHHYSVVKRLPKSVKKILFAVLKRYFYEEQINTFMEENANKDTFSYIEAIIEYFNLSISLKTNELTRIPAYGRAIVVANHPLGALDAIALLYLLKDVRKDVKIVGNSFFSQFENLKDIVIPLDTAYGKMDRKELKNIYKALEQEQMLIVFPSGEVSRPKSGVIKDKRWKSGFLRIATKMKAPIVPIYVKAKNSQTFYFLSSINSRLATISLPHEMFKAKNKTIEFKIGKVIPFESYNMPHFSQKESVTLLRKHLFKIAKNHKPIFATQNEISLAEDRTELKTTLKKGKSLGKTSDGKSIIIYDSKVENSVIKEIGRLREISFRYVGEGSGKKRDIDEYDFYYKHLIIWDDEALEIVGAYRLGMCKEIIEEFGIEGLYTSTLFNFEDEFKPYLEEGIELGRSFVQPKYWNSRALDYLWQGIGTFVQTEENIRYLFGGVSISDSFTQEAQGMMIYFYKHYFPAQNRNVRHKEPYKLSISTKKHCETIFKGNDYRTDIRRLKEEFGFMGFSVPTLFKQYSELCEEGGVQFLDFGYDKDFNNCIDGFIVTDLELLKETKRKRYFK